MSKVSATGRLELLRFLIFNSVALHPGLGYFSRGCRAPLLMAFCISLNIQVLWVCFWTRKHKQMTKTLEVLWCGGELSVCNMAGEETGALLLKKRSLGSSSLGWFCLTEKWFVMLLQCLALLLLSSVFVPYCVPNGPTVLQFLGLNFAYE